MHEGRDFLRAQVSNCVMQHKTLLESLEDHAKQAEDAAFRTLCERYIPRMQQHQQTLNAYRTTLGEEGGQGLKGALGFVLGKAKDVADSLRTDDFLRVVEDIVMIRQAQDTFATFAAAGDRIGEPRLSEIGRTCETEHDQMQRDFNGLVQEMFVRQATKSA
ncbi:MAG TPA: hypothetical protein VGB24_02110 [Longimicrobium sp.]|jgi:hypothetical protein|uniref:hypothetical protein n=1 Tax=Longimicrobium sp. TaxID=2029185 RepID=UPI002EDAF281